MPSKGNSSHGGLMLVPANDNQLPSEYRDRNPSSRTNAAVVTIEEPKNADDELGGIVVLGGLAYLVCLVGYACLTDARNKKEWDRADKEWERKVGR